MFGNSYLDTTMLKDVSHGHILGWKCKVNQEQVLEGLIFTHEFTTYLPEAHCKSGVILLMMEIKFVTLHCNLTDILVKTKL